MAHATAKPKARTKPARAGAGRNQKVAPASVLTRLRKICLALPETAEKIAWCEPTWRVKGKLFAQMDTYHHGADRVAVWLPAEMGAQEALVETHPRHFFRPPYVGHKGWIGVRLDSKLDWGVVAGLVEQAYCVVAPPRLVAQLDASRRSPPVSGRPRRA